MPTLEEILRGQKNLTGTPFVKAPPQRAALLGGNPVMNAAANRPPVQNLRSTLINADATAPKPGVQTVKSPGQSVMDAARNRPTPNTRAALLSADANPDPTDSRLKKASASARKAAAQPPKPATAPKVTASKAAKAAGKASKLGILGKLTAGLPQLAQAPYEFMEGNNLLGALRTAAGIGSVASPVTAGANLVLTGLEAAGVPETATDLISKKLYEYGLAESPYASDYTGGVEVADGVNLPGAAGQPGFSRGAPPGYMAEAQRRLQAADQPFFPTESPTGSVLQTVAQSAPRTLSKAAQASRVTGGQQQTDTPYRAQEMARLGALAEATRDPNANAVFVPRADGLGYDYGPGYDFEGPRPAWATNPIETFSGNMRYMEGYKGGDKGRTPGYQKITDVDPIPTNDPEYQAYVAQQLAQILPESGSTQRIENGKVLTDTSNLGGGAAGAGQLQQLIRGRQDLEAAQAKAIQDRLDAEAKRQNELVDAESERVFKREQDDKKIAGRLKAAALKSKNKGSAKTPKPPRAIKFTGQDGLERIIGYDNNGKITRTVTADDAPAYIVPEIARQLNVSNKEAKEIWAERTNKNMALGAN